MRGVRLRAEAALASRVPSFYHAILRRWGRSNSIKVLLAALVRRGDVVFDVGANRGFHTALMSNLAGPTGAIHAFEPSPDTCRMLEATLRARAPYRENVIVNTSAAGMEDGVTTLYTPMEDHGQASLQKHDAGSWSAGALVNAITCRVTRLDSYCAAHAISRIDVVKMDIEGAELLALRGFGESLKKHLPVVVLELCAEWTRAFGYEPTDAIAALRGAGYDTFRIVSESGTTLPLGDERLINDGHSRDVIAAVSGRHASRLARAGE